MTEFRYSTIHGQDVNSSPKPLLAERVTGGFETITTDHGYIHEGIAYTVATSSTVATSGTYKVWFKTPATEYIHFKPTGIAANGGPVTVTLLEGVTATGGTVTTPRNRSRVAATPDVAAMTVKLGSTVSATGTPISRLYVASATQGQQKLGSSTAAAEEFVLKRNTDYGLVFTNNAGSTTTVFLDAYWYEESGA